MKFRHHGLMAVVLGALTLSIHGGCKKTTGGRTIQPEVLAQSPSAIYAPASDRATYFAANGKPLRYCAEPMPDAASDRLSSATVEGSHKGDLEFENSTGVSVKVGSENTLKSGQELKISSKEMGGRDSTVLLARELMYRLCEVGLNFDPATTPDAYRAAREGYLEVAKLVAELATAERSRAEAEKAKAEAEKAKAEAEKTAAETKLIEIKEKAADQVSLVRLFVSTIIANVTEPKDGKCAINQDRLMAALKAERFNNIRSALLNSKGCGDLNDELLPLAPDVLRELAAAAQTTQTKK